MKPAKENLVFELTALAIPDNLMEALLFGYVEGAFSGAKKGGQPGIFEKANGGTLFLDEVGESEVQPYEDALTSRAAATSGKGAMLPRISPVGDFGDVRHSDVRIISATNRDLIKEVEAGKFREDLFYRLAVIKVKLPPLRSRKTDIPELIDILMKKSNEDFPQE